MTFTRTIEKLVFGIVVVYMIGGTAVAAPLSGDPEWLMQWGSPGNDQVFDATSNGAGGCCYTGLTNGNYGGANQGSFDIIGGCVDANGEEEWRGQWGTADPDSCEGICSDADGDVLMGGGSAGDFCCEGNNGGFDAAAVEVDQSGIENYRVQYGTPLTDGILGVDCDDLGGRIAAGFTGANASLAGWGRNGGDRWTFGVSSAGTDVFKDVVFFPPNAGIVTGWTTGSLGGDNLGGRDIYVGSHNSDASTNWDIQIGTPFAEEGERIVIDLPFLTDSSVISHVYVTGHTFGSLFDQNAGNADAFVIKLSSTTGKVEWGRQLGSNQSDRSHALASDGMGGVLIAGETNGILGRKSAGGTDAFIAHYDGDGNLLSVRQFGTTGSDKIYGIVLDNTAGVGGNFLVAGSTTGSLGGPNAGSWDVFVAKFPINPCPGDLDGSGDVGVKDLLILLGSWGPCKGCPADFDNSGDVGVKDLLVLLGAWGPCP